MTSAPLRRGGRRAPGIGGCSVGGVGTRLAGCSRRCAALAENRLLKQHDISRNESPPPPHIYTLLAKLHPPPPPPPPSRHASPSSLLDGSSHFRFPPQSFPVSSADPRPFKGAFHLRRTAITPLAVSTCLLSPATPNPTPLMNHEGCRKAATGGDIPKSLCLVTCHLPE